MKQPLVSIIIPSYNSAAYLPAVLDAVFAQTYSHFEVILVDDGSTDETAAVVYPYSDRLIYHRIENSGSPTRPRNVGIARARGELIAFCDSDDLFLPDKLADAVAIFEGHPQVGVVVSDFRCLNAQGKVIRESWLAPYQEFRHDLVPTADPRVFLVSGPDIYRHLLRHNFIGTPGVVARRSAITGVGSFDESLANAEDRDLWLRLARAGHGFAVHLKVQFVYCKHTGGITSRGWRLVPALITVLEKQRPFLLSPSDRRWVIDRLRGLRLGYAWRLRQDGDYDAALDYIQQALEEGWSWSAIRAMLLTRLQKLLAA